MKDSKGNEIGLKRLDMLTDEDLETLKGDAFDDWNWKTGSPFARLVYDFCVIEENNRIRKNEQAKRDLEIAKAKMEANRQVHEMQQEMSRIMNASTKELLGEIARPLVEKVAWKNK